MILTFRIQIIEPSQYILHFLILLMEPNHVLVKELQNLDLDSDSSFTSQELANFDREKLLEFALKARPSPRRREVQLHFI